MKPLLVALVLAMTCTTVPSRGWARELRGVDGAPCIFNRDCLSGKCRGGAFKRCQGPPLLPDGAPCTRNAQCSSGRCRGGANKQCQGD